MNKGFVYFSAMMLYSGVSLAQVIDLGIEEKPLEPTKEENKVSLFVRFIDIATGEYETRIVNKNR